MADETSLTPSRWHKLFWLVLALAILGTGLFILLGCRSAPASDAEMVSPLATAQDACVICHRAQTPGIIEQFGASVMAVNGVTCRDCHEVSPDYPGAEDHYNVFLLASPTPARCQSCHATEVAQFNQGRHSLPAYVAVNGTKNLSPQQMALYQAIPEGGFDPNKTENTLYVLEGETVSRFACDSCHNIGQPNADGSAGKCRSCHLRHTFSLEQVRRPETCSACHIGPDHPQWEIYQQSAHGIAYATDGDNWEWNAVEFSAKDTPAPVCATCHISGFGGASASHDVGDRLTWYLFASTSSQRPDWEQNAERMQAVCQQCHSSDFIDRLYGDADKLTNTVNDWVKESDAVMAPLKDKSLLTPAPFDEPIDFVYYEIWHHWGRTAKFGAWMGGADYVQWHGVYEMLRSLAELRDMAQDRLAGK
jgi:hydroxylamine dehydrogenase